MLFGLSNSMLFSGKFARMNPIIPWEISEKTLLEMLRWLHETYGAGE